MLSLFVKHMMNMVESQFINKLPHDHSMLGMVVHAEISVPSLVIFIHGSQSAGTFIELIGHYQGETENMEEHNRFWLLHGDILDLLTAKLP